MPPTRKHPQKKKASAEPAKASRSRARTLNAVGGPKRGAAAGKSRKRTVDIRAQSQIVVVKFRDNKKMEIPYTDGWADKPDLITGEFKDEIGSIKLLRMFTSVSPDRIRELTEISKRAHSRYRSPNFLTYFLLELASPDDAARIVRRLWKSKVVELAYVDLPTTDAQVGSIDPLHCKSSSGHASPGPTGVGTSCAARFQGGDGAGLRFIDVEAGWNRAHDSLTMHNIPSPLAGIETDIARGHGTAVLGIICGNGQSSGQKGIAPNVDSVKVSSCIPGQQSTNTSRQNIHDAILAAIDDLEVTTTAPTQANRGRCGLLLIERQLKIFASGAAIHLPVEVFPTIFELIQFAVFGLRITVVEAAGNGREQAGGSAAGFDLNNIDLSSFKTNGRPIFMPNALQVDSGAIIVSGVQEAVIGTGHNRLAAGNFGARVDCYAWGEGVVAACTQRKSPNSPQFTDDDCINDFGGTSAAAAIIAGVALIVQGMVAKATGGAAILPTILRAGLRKHTMGTPVFDLSSGRNPIGVMPDLCKALTPDATAFQHVFGVAPVSLRRR